MQTHKLGKVLWLALQYAKADRESFVDAYSGNTKEKAVRDALQNIKDFDAAMVMLFGTTRDALQVKTDAMLSMDIYEYMDRMDSDGRLKDS